MELYKKMYYKLFDSTSKTIELLEEAQRETEKMYLLEKEPDFKLIEKDGKGKEGK